MPQVETGKSPADLVLTPLDGDSTIAAKHLRNALRDMIKVYGKAALATKLNAIAVANGFTV